MDNQKTIEKEVEERVKKVAGLSAKKYLFKGTEVVLRPAFTLNFYHVDTVAGVYVGMIHSEEKIFYCSELSDGFPFLKSDLQEVGIEKPVSRYHKRKAEGKIKTKNI